VQKTSLPKGFKEWGKETGGPKYEESGFKWGLIVSVLGDKKGVVITDRMTARQPPARSKTGEGGAEIKTQN